MKKILIVALAAGLLVGCDDDTKNIGTVLMPDSEQIETSVESFQISTKTLQMDSVLVGGGSSCLLGAAYDEQSLSSTKCGFVAQYHIFENYRFPERERMIIEDGKVLADSCDVVLYFDDYVGDPTSTMVVKVEPLDTLHMLEESKQYYSNFNVNPYIDKKSPYHLEQAYNVAEILSHPHSELEAKGKVRIMLPKEYGTFLINKYYENPEFFANSYNFSHHVCPGFAFSSAAGVGSIIKVDLSALNVYFKFHDKTKAGNDTIVEGMQRIVSTEEVIQNAFMKSETDPSFYTEERGRTFVASPAIAMTEMAIPIDDIVMGDKYNDTINQARIDLPVLTSDKDLSQVPQMLLMVRKDKREEFFLNEVLADNRTTFCAPFNRLAKAYVFENIASLVKRMKDERNSEAGVKNEDNEEVRKEKWAKWEAEHPNWNKVELVAVKPQYSVRHDAYGQTSRVLLRIENKLEPSCVGLLKGDRLKIDVVYSHSKNE